MTELWLLILTFCVATLAQGLFAGYETGFVSTNLIRIRFLAEEEHQRRASALLRNLGRPDQMLSMLLIGTNIATIVATMAVTRAALAYSESYGELIATLIVTPTLLVFAEIIPKSVFRKHPNRLSLAMLPVIRIFDILLAPLSLPVAWATRILLRTSGGERQYLSPLMATREDVRVLVDESADHGTIDPEERKMIHSVINLQGRQAKEIMVPRIDVQAVPDTATREELLKLFVETGRTRIPVFRETVDTVIGVVNAHDLLLDAEAEEQDIARFVREVIHVPDTMNLDDLFQLLKDSKQHLAIVTDEYGGTDGLITIEDILEEIFGEIQDEHDREESPITQVGPDAYVVDARMSLAELAEQVDVPIDDEVVETVGGWLMHVAGRIPARGEVIKENGFRVTVLEADSVRVFQIRLEVLPGARDGGTE